MATMYPYIKSQTHLKVRRGLCNLCGKNRADMRVNIANGESSCDDTAYNAHWQCLDDHKGWDLDLVISKLIGGSL